MQALRAAVIFRVKLEISIGVLLEHMSSQLIERLSSSMLDADDLGALYPQQLNIQKSFHIPNFRVSAAITCDSLFMARLGIIRFV